MTFTIDYKGYTIDADTYQIYREGKKDHKALSIQEAYRYIDGKTPEEERKTTKMKPAEFERTVIQNIKDYIRANDLSINKIAEEAGMDYYHLWSLLNRNRNLKLNDYVAFCRAVQEPLEYFITE